MTIGNEAGAPERRKLGRTGAELSVIGFGGIVLMGYEQPECNRIVHTAHGAGVNYFDVAPSYGAGEAEEKLGPALVGLRDASFLACKTAERGRDGARAELEQSLRRLKTDRFDLYQLHGLANMDELDRATAPGGALEVLTEARQEGKARFLGFSAHSVEVALEAMARFDFDTVLFPLNYVCWHRGGFGQEVVAEAVRRDMGILALKSLAKRPWSHGEERKYGNCWYHPIDDEAEAADALAFTLSLPVAALLPPGDARLFDLALGIASHTAHWTAPDLDRLMQRSEGVEPIFKRSA